MLQNAMPQRQRDGKASYKFSPAGLLLFIGDSGRKAAAANAAQADAISKAHSFFQ